MAERILIIRLSSIGDILHAFPAYQSLRNAFPSAEIDWLVEGRMKFLLSALSGINKVLTLDSSTTLRHKPWSPTAWRQLFTLARNMRSNRYDLSIDFQGLLKTAFLSYLSGAKVRIGYSKGRVRERPADWFYHQTESPSFKEPHVIHLNLALARAAGGVSNSMKLPLEATEDDRRQIQSRLQDERLFKFVIINPGGGWPTKLWNPSKYGDLAARIQRELKLNVVITTGPGESHLYDAIRRNCSFAPPSHFAVPFLQLIPLCHSARLFIAGDTGPFHLACALGTPVVGIFGPTSPVRNGPTAEEDNIVVHELPCSFCYGRSCPTQNECMDITVDEVFGAVWQRLSLADGRRPLKSQIPNYK